MLVLVDESLPRRLAGALSGHDARTVRQMGWLGTSNGELLRRAEDAGIDAFVTADRNLEFQQNLTRFSFGVIVLVVPRTAPETILPLDPRIVQSLGQIESGDVVHIGTDIRRDRG